MMLYMVAGALCLCLISFLIMHLYFIITSTSSIEMSMLMRGNPFSHQNKRWRNVTDVMGVNVMYWFLPWEPQSAQHPGCDGFNWKIRRL